MAAEAGFCLAWSETPEDTFCRVVAHIIITFWHIQHYNNLNLLTCNVQNKTIKHKGHNQRVFKERDVTHIV